MTYKNIRIGLYIERLLVAFSSGLFLILPLYFKQYGWNELFFAKIFAFGAIGTILCVSFSAFFIRIFGLKKVAPLGSLLFSISCILYFISDYEQYIIVYYIASLIQGAGWGLIFTMGPICMSTTLDNQNRSYYLQFTQLIAH